MAVVITDLLGQDSFSGSRLTINANFHSLKSEIDTIESIFGLSLSSGNLDISAATGGQIKAKVGAFNSIQLPSAGTPVITLNGTTGAMTGSSLVVTGAITATTININLSGTFNNQGSSTFDGQATFEDLVKFNAGRSRKKVDIGASTTHTVINTDNVIVFDGTASPAIMSLTPDASLVDGHEFTLVSKGTGPCSLDTSNILGYTSGSIDFNAGAYKSSITLMFSLADSAWIVTASNNMTLV